MKHIVTGLFLVLTSTDGWSEDVLLCKDELRILQTTDFLSSHDSADSLNQYQVAIREKDLTLKKRFGNEFLQIAKFEITFVNDALNIIAADAGCTFSLGELSNNSYNYAHVCNSFGIVYSSTGDCTKEE